MREKGHSGNWKSCHMRGSFSALRLVRLALRDRSDRADLQMARSTERWASLEVPHHLRQRALHSRVMLRSSCGRRLRSAADSGGRSSGLSSRKVADGHVPFQRASHRDLRARRGSRRPGCSAAPATAPACFPASRCMVAGSVSSGGIWRHRLRERRGRAEKKRKRQSGSYAWRSPSKPLNYRPSALLAQVKV